MIEIGFWQNDQLLRGRKFYAKDGAVVLQTGFDWVATGYCQTHTMHLEDGERLIGYKTGIVSDTAVYYDFQLVIERLI